MKTASVPLDTGVPLCPQSLPHRHCCHFPGHAELMGRPYCGLCVCEDGQVSVALPGCCVPCQALHVWSILPFPNTYALPVMVKVTALRSSSCAWPFLLNTENAGFLTVFSFMPHTLASFICLFFSLFSEELGFVRGKETLRKRHVASLKALGTLEAGRSWCNVMAGDLKCSGGLQVVERWCRLKVFLEEVECAILPSCLYTYTVWLLWPRCSSAQVISLCFSRGTERRQGRILLQLSEIPQLNCFCCSLYCKSNES